MSGVAAGFEAQEHTGAFGMWVFLASEVLFFGTLLLAYAWGRGHWPAGFAAASRETHVVIGTLNTALLLTSSALVALAVEAVRGYAGVAPREHDPRLGVGDGRRAAPLLWAAAALGLVFLALKAAEYTLEFREQLVPGASFRLRAQAGAELFYVLYFLATGLHAVHLAIGIVLLGALAHGSRHAARWAQPRHVEAAGLYWHFVDVVWIFLYPLIYLGGRSG